MAFREINDIQLDSPQKQAATPVFKQVQDIQLDAPESTPKQNQVTVAGGDNANQDQTQTGIGLGKIAARTGRIATGIAASIADLPVIVGQSAYDSTRALQSIAGAAVAPEYKIPLPSEGAKKLYDLATNNAGRTTGAAETIDTAAEFIAPLGATLIRAAPGLVEAATRGLAPKIEGATKELAIKARDFGISLRADQIAPTRLKNSLQKISQELPFSGADNFEVVQRGQWNKALANTIGEKTLDPNAIESFITRNSNDFEKVLSGKSVRVGKAELDSLADVRLKKSSDAKDAINDYIQDITNNIQKGFITGEVLNSVRSGFIRDLPTKNGDIKNALSEILDKVDGIINKRLSTLEKATIKNARNEYRNFKTIEPLLEKATNGEINPTDLMAKVASSKYIRASRKSTGDDQLVDLARIGKEFMVKKGGSDTYTKQVIGGSLPALGLTAMQNPLLATGVAAAEAGVLGLNRAYQGVNQSQGLIDIALRGAPRRSTNISTPLTLINASNLSSVGN